MKKIQLNSDDLQEMLRENGNHSLSEIQYGIMEKDGKFSIIEKKPEKKSGQSSDKESPAT